MLLRGRCISLEVVIGRDSNGIDVKNPRIFIKFLRLGFDAIISWSVKPIPPISSLESLVPDGSTLRTVGRNRGHDATASFIQFGEHGQKNQLMSVM